MYYETTMHKRRAVVNAEAAARLIHERQDEQGEYLHDYDAIVWKSPDGRELAAVGDNHCNNPWAEVAVIDLTNKQQIESITFAWIDSLDEKIRQFSICETTDFRIGGADLPLDGQGDDIPATFECGCCGEGFKSTLKNQRKFDQDNGYGICPDCARRYYS